ncbi:MAG: hypothetical protein KDD52_09350 [Bdellovibrionales bacterium]|nr:hypothetical protein [Bdellovibrionales bacterium]
MRLFGLAIFCGYMLTCLSLVSPVFAQDDDFFSPPISSDPPPWVTGGDEKKDSGGSSSGDSKGSGSESAPEPFFPGMDDGDDGDDDFSLPSFSAPSSSSSSSSGVPKESFKWAGEEEQEAPCIGWGNPLLGVTLYESQTLCEDEVSSSIDHFKKTLRFVEEDFESFKLKHQIKNNLSRQQSKSIAFDFSQSDELLSHAYACVCLG